MFKSPKQIIYIILVILTLGSISYNEDIYDTSNGGLPPRKEYNTWTEACLAAWDRCDQLRAQPPVAVIGTGSMAPYIPASRKGLNPRKTIVAYVVKDPRQTYKSINNKDSQGKLIIYAAQWSKPPGKNVMHTLFEWTTSGWIPMGIANSLQETDWRVTEKNFIAVIDSAYIWKQ